MELVLPASLRDSILTVYMQFAPRCATVSICQLLLISVDTALLVDKNLGQFCWGLS